VHDGDVHNYNWDIPKLNVSIFKGFQRPIDFLNLNYYNWMKA
jgi:hypothetical protein